ncbi:calcium-binding mitochondrial carrier protein Aralar1-like isoform X2 [Varroa jacobsoni]|uniref:EF-hand domain-containing protein n=1 Tax=Varroa destructor TaxID=109461 RepID=A0A7M7J0L4_VARDE|nr:calcium-binding mitochondrial carrier protein Aralar1-like isoform X3 [Varroa destructor]XP_022701230.1 calcium-binding mitochondrial carrier protein Aralar1-like isoform X2 [Varroa jacobsoni]
MEQAQYIRRADSNRLRDIFNKYASVEQKGERYMTANDFVVRYLGFLPESNANPKSLTLLGNILDTSKDGLISFREFEAYEGLLCHPEAIYRTAFQLFDTDGSGHITENEFEQVIKHTTLHEKIPFDFSSDFVVLHFGGDRKRTVTYAEFSQVLQDFHEEHAVQAFKKYDPKKTGAITSMDFTDIMLSCKSHLLSENVKKNLVAVAASEHGGHKVSFPYFMAFCSLLNNMELVKKIYLHFTKGDTRTEMTREEFAATSAQMSHMTPLEIDILFNLCSFLSNSSGRITYSDLEKVAPYRPTRAVLLRPIAEVKAVEKPEDRGIGIQVLESTYRFLLGSIAGACGATVVYPIDLVKTRMQNQRTGSIVGEIMYRNSLDCAKKVLRHEGLFGFYRGLLPQLVGVAPEKAIKLTMNDLVRDKFTDEKGNIPFWAEILAGAMAGGSQVMFTNPLEIVKIRLQVAGEIAGGHKVSALGVIRDLGLTGLYKGSRACFLRDVPFSAIYFPVYAHMKLKTQDDEGRNSPLSLLGSAFIAGVPAAYLVTPADVIKTRLQVAARAGQTTYSGVIDACGKIFKEEGFSAFWKGGPARVFRSSPQFGFTLLTYEVLQRLFYVDFGGRRPTGSETSPAPMEKLMSHNPDHIGGYKMGLATFRGVETKFGLFLPKFG